MADNPLDDPGTNSGRVFGRILDDDSGNGVWNARAVIARLGLADNGMPPCRMTNWVYRDSDDSGFFSIEFRWSRLSDNAVILQSGPLVPYDLTAFTGSRVRVGIFSSKQVDNGYSTTALHDQRLLCVPAFTSISTSMITDWAKGDGGALRKKVVDKFTDTDFFKQVKEAVDKHPLAKLGALRENSLALIGAVEVRMTAR